MKKKWLQHIKIIQLFLLLILLFSMCTSPVQQFNNPILAGFYPDPSICRVDEDYYLVNSTFAYFPGIPVFHSKDLANWQLIGYVLNRPEQLDLDNLGVSRGIFAPAIRYHEGVFYVTCTVVDGGGNFIVTASDPSGPWSNPVWIPEVNGIDPSMFFDDDGKAYIVYNSDAPDNLQLYNGHRTLRIYEFDVNNLNVTGNEYLLVNGGTDINKKPVWIEGPHIYKKDGYYYLMAAEGGTSYNHSEVVFRSKNVTGPYIPYDNNPILTQRHLNPNRKNPITSTGHADLVQTQNGDWWAVFLGCRPYGPVDQDFYNLGRETFLAPVSWEDGWPVINPEFDEVQYTYPIPIHSPNHITGWPYSGNFTIKDEFVNEELDMNWMYLRTPRKQWYSLSKQKGDLTLQLLPVTCSDSANPAFIARRQQHFNGYASVSMIFNANTENEKAGLVVFQNENFYYYICKSLVDNKPAVQLYRSLAPGDEENEVMELLESRYLANTINPEPLMLKIESHTNTYSFYYSESGNDWNLLKDNVDAKFLSTKIAGGFVGCMYAMYATSIGNASNNSVIYQWFEYSGNDDLYMQP